MKDKELLARTQTILSKHYGRPVSEEEAEVAGRRLGRLGVLFLDTLIAEEPSDSSD